jgi:hypothetical protein
MSFWREVGEAPEATLRRIELGLAEAAAPVRRDDGYHEWDLQVEAGALGAARLRSCVEWHGGERQLVRFAIHPRMSGVARAIAVSGAALWGWALADGATAAAAMLGCVVALVVVRSLWECGVSAAVLVDAVYDSEARRERATDPVESPSAPCAAVVPTRPLRATG